MEDVQKKIEKVFNERMANISHTELKQKFNDFIRAKYEKIFLSVAVGMSSEEEIEELLMFSAVNCILQKTKYEDNTLSI